MPWWGKAIAAAFFAMFVTGFAMMFFEIGQNPVILERPFGTPKAQ